MLAGALDDLHCQCKIRDKVVRTTSDSGSNFVKALNVFGAQNDANQYEADQEAHELTDHL